MATSSSVSITLDGRSLTAPERHTDAAAVLRLGGLDPAAYDLALIRPGGADPKRFRDNQPVELHDGDSFVSVRQVAPVA